MQHGSKIWRRSWWAGLVGIPLCLAAAAPPAKAPSGPATAPPGPKRDWKAYPAIVEVQETHDFYAVADIHGDYPKAVELLAAAKIIAGVPAAPAKVQWAAGSSTLVCTGDMIDKWTQSIEVLELMRTLQADAQARGGRVIVTLGNHEADFLASGGGTKKAAEFQKELLAQGIDPADVAAGRDAGGLGAWLRNRPVAATVNDWFFCHAGNTFGMRLQAMETAVESGVDKDGFGTFILAQPNSILQAPMGGVPWWISAEAAGTSLPAPTETSTALPGAARLRAYAAALGCHHLVVGHHPGKVTFGAGMERPAGAPFAYAGVLFLMDTGMSHGAQDGRGAILKIHPGLQEHASVIDATGKESPLWAAP